MDIGAFSACRAVRKEIAELDEVAESLGVCSDGGTGCVGRFRTVLIYAALTKRPKKQRSAIVYRRK